MDRNDRLVFVEVTMKLMMLLIELYRPLSCCGVRVSVQCDPVCRDSGTGADNWKPARIMRINCIHLKSLASESVENL